MRARAIVGVVACTVFSADAYAATKKKPKNVDTDGSAEPRTAPAAPATVPAAPAATPPTDAQPTLDFDFFDGSVDGTSENPANRRSDLVAAPDIERKAQTRRWMLRAHQTLGMTTWALMASTVVIGQLNYNELYGGGSGSTRWQTTHRVLVVSTSVAFAATGALALLAPTPYKRPARFDTALVHRIAVIGATLGMVTQAVLGWRTARQAEAGNPDNLRTMARTHQIVGYTTFTFLTAAGAVWFF